MMTEEELKNMLNSLTDDACAKKEEVRTAIKRNVHARRPRTRNHPVAWAAVAAALVLVCFMGLTEPGRALTASIRSLFEPQKPVTVNIEGFSEEKTEALAPDPKEHYAFYYDTEQFECCRRDGAEVLLPRNQDGSLPEISLSINRIENASAQALYQNALKADVTDLGAIDAPVKGYGMEIWRGQEWNSPVTVVYWMDDGFGSAYQFTLNGFAEAYEGAIQRMKQILTTFVAVQ